MKFCHFKYTIVLAACISGLSVISCGSTPKVAGSDVSPVYVTNSKKYYLIEPSKIEKEIDSYLALKGKFGVNEFTCLSMLQMNDKGVYLCLLSDFGTTLVVVVVQELPLMESKPVKVLGRPAKTDAPFWG